MSNPAPIVLASDFVASLLSAARERGYEIDGFLRDAGIDPQAPQDLYHQVTVGQYAILLRKTIAGLDDEGMALFSRKLRRGSYALMVRSALTSNTLAGGVYEFTHTLRLIQDDLDPVLINDGGLTRVELRFSNQQVECRYFAHEFLLRLIWRFMTWLEGGNLRPLRVDLAFPRPKHAGSYQKIFPAELSFEAAHSTIWFDSKALQAPVRRDASHLQDYLHNALLDLLVPAIPTRISDRVRAYLQESRARDCSWPDLEQTS